MRCQLCHMRSRTWIVQQGYKIKTLKGLAQYQEEQMFHNEGMLSCELTPKTFWAVGWQFIRSMEASNYARVMSVQVHVPREGTYRTWKDWARSCLATGIAVMASKPSVIWSARTKARTVLWLDNAARELTNAVLERLINLNLFAEKKKGILEY